MSQHRRHDEQNLYIENEIGLYFGVVGNEVGERNGNESFQEVYRENRQCRPASQHAKHVGGAGIMAAVFPDVNPVIVLGQSTPHSVWSPADKPQSSKQ